MTEEEWTASDDPIAMHQVVEEGLFRMKWPDSKRTERKRVLFCLACCRLVWPLIEADPRSVQYYGCYDRHVEEPVSDDEWDSVGRDMKQATKWPEDGTPGDVLSAANLVYDIGDTEMTIAQLIRSFDWGDEQQRTRDTTHFLRCIAGNPFRPVTFDPMWRTETVVSLASGIYADRVFDRMPILADALEEAGCDHAGVLSHCRGPRPHARGCWVVDGVLGKH